MHKEQFIESNGVHLHVVTAGSEDGSPVLVLHGFPEFWRCWHHQIDALAEAGYFVIAPDQRGYNLSDKPLGVKNYDIEILVADMTGLMDALGYEKFDLIAHDWGGVVALQLAEKYPERVKCLVVSNAPHLHILARALMRNPFQIIKSWYVVFFQLPTLPDYLFLRGMGMWVLNSSNPGSFSEEELALYQQAWDKVGTPNTMINWYRAAFRKLMGEVLQAPFRFRNPYKLFLPPKILPPTLILWGEKDAFLTKNLAETLLNACQNAEIHYFPDATHWLPSDKPKETSQLILDFLAD